MDKYIKVYDNAIDELSCSEIIKKFEDSHESFETVHQEECDNIISFETVL